MFSSIKKKDDEYKQQKITYPILGLLLGTTLGYYAPFVFLFTKFLSVTAVGGIGGYSGVKITNKYIEDNYYKECAFEKYSDYNEKFNINDYLFRKYIMDNPEFDINYSYRILKKNINDSDHVLSKCYHDMLNKFNEIDDNKKDIKEILNYYFYHICQYLMHIKEEETEEKKTEMESIINFRPLTINNNLLKVFDFDEEIFLKIYISIEEIIVEDVYDNIIKNIYESNKEIDHKILKNRESILEIEKTNIKLNNIDCLWLRFFGARSPYEKLSIFYEINISIAKQLEKINKQCPGADELMPCLIQSILEINYDKLYSDYVYLNIVYNEDIYSNIFEFLIAKYNSIIKYIVAHTIKQPKVYL
jgi:hypothetical protein